MNRGNYFSCLTDFSTLGLGTFLLCLLLSACGGRGEGVRSFDTGRSFEGQKFFAPAENREERQERSVSALRAKGENGPAKPPAIEPTASGADGVISRQDMILGLPVILFDQDGLPDGGIYEVDDRLPEDGSLRLGEIVSGNTYKLFAGQMDLPGQFERIDFSSIEFLKIFNEWGEYDYAGSGLFSVQLSENVLTHRGRATMKFDFANNQMTDFSFTSSSRATVRLRNVDMGNMNESGNGFSGMQSFETSGEDFVDLSGRSAMVNTEFFGDFNSEDRPAGAITTVEGEGFSGAFALRGVP